MVFKFRRKELPWEVVDSHGVDPVLYYDDEDDLDIEFTSKELVSGTYTFEVKRITRYTAARNAVVFARQQVQESAVKKGFNHLREESWKLTIYRRGKNYRIEVQYSARPARTLGKISEKTPPFIEVLRDFPILASE